MVAAFHLTLEPAPLVIARTNYLQFLQLVHHLIHGFLHRLGEIAVGLLSLNRFQLFSQLRHLLLDLRASTDSPSHLLGEFSDGLPSFPHHFILRLRFLLVGVEHLLTEDLVGERGLDLADALSGEIGLTGYRRPRHHVYMGVLHLIMESGVPSEVIRRNVHGGDVVVVCPEQIHPHFSIVAVQPCCILPFQGEDVRPYLSSVVVQFFHGLCQVHAVLITKQTMPPSRSALGRVAMYFM